MKVLSPKIISTVRSGSYQYAVIESMSYGRATVRLGGKGNGTRLTNLSVVGAAEIGGLVIVDYSTVVPYVKSVQYYKPDEPEEEEAPAPTEPSGGPCGGY